MGRYSIKTTRAIFDVWAISPLFQHRILGMACNSKNKHQSATNDIAVACLYIY